MSRPNPMILIGFMGTGKSTVASYFKEQCNVRIVDLDDYIVAKEGRTIPEIFSQEGEAHFRQLEGHYLNQCIDEYDIISTGGGIVQSDTAMKRLRAQPYVIWLDCDMATVFKRINEDANRPNAAGKSEEELKSLYSSRVSRYNEIAFMKVNSSQNVHNIYEEITNVLPCE